MLHLMRKDDADIFVRQASCTLFKNYVISSWEAVRALSVLAPALRPPLRLCTPPLRLDPFFQPELPLSALSGSGRIVRGILTDSPALTLTGLQSLNFLVLVYIGHDPRRGESRDQKDIPLLHACSSRQPSTTRIRHPLRNCQVRLPAAVAEPVACMTLSLTMFFSTRLMLQDLVSKLNTNDFNVIVGVLKIVNAVTKKYRWAVVNEDTTKEVVFILNHFQEAHFTMLTVRNVASMPRPYCFRNLPRTLSPTRATRKRSNRSSRPASSSWTLCTLSARSICRNTWRTA